MSWSPDPNAAGWRGVQDRYRFTTLLAALVALLVGPSLFGDVWLNSFWYDALVAVMLLGAVASLAVERRHRRFALLFGIPTFVFLIGGSGLADLTGSWSAIAGHSCAMLFFFVASWLIVLAMFRPARVSHDAIVGAICGYLFLGLGWAMAFAVLEHFDSGTFAVSDRLAELSDTEPVSTGLLVYFSFVTLTTVGYGDITPVGPTVRTLAWMEAISGQFYLAVIVAGIVTMLAGRLRGKADDASGQS